MISVRGEVLLMPAIIGHMDSESERGRPAASARASLVSKPANSPKVASPCGKFSDVSEEVWQERVKAAGKNAAARGFSDVLPQFQRS